MSDPTASNLPLKLTDICPPTQITRPNPPKEDIVPPAKESSGRQQLTLPVVHTDDLDDSTCTKKRKLKDDSIWPSDDDMEMTCIDEIGVIEETPEQGEEQTPYVKLIIFFLFS